LMMIILRASSAIAAANETLMMIILRASSVIAAAN
jgi:hypothetical protein